MAASSIDAPKYFLSQDYFTPVIDHLRKELISGVNLHCDETPVQVLKKVGKKPQTKSYMWLYRTGDAEGFLHENFFLLPIGFFIFSGIVTFTVTGIRNLVTRVKNIDTLGGEKK